MSLQVRRPFFSLPPQNDSPLFAFLQAREEALIICRAERVGGPIVSFSTGDLTSTIWAFFWPRLQLFPPLLSESATFKTHALLFSDFHGSSDPSQADVCGFFFFSPVLVSWDGKCFCCPSWIERSARLRPLWCEEMSGATAGQRLGQWQPTLGARVFSFFFFLCVCLQMWVRSK